MSVAEPIQSAGDPRAQRIADLAKPGHANTKVALVEDEAPLVNALAAGVGVLEVYCEAGQTASGELVEACARAGVAITAIDPALLTKLFRTDKRPRLFGVVKVPHPARLGALLERPGDIVVLDGVRIVGNIGAIIRTATAFAAAGVVLVDSGLTSVADRRLLRASRGHVFSLPVILAEGGPAREFLREQRIGGLVADARGELTLAQAAAAPGRLALVFGGERGGPSGQFGGEAGFQTAAIAMPGPVESLNVSVAVGIVLQARSLRAHPAGGLD
ncbi:MAG: NshR/TsnR family 23S rRNA methyltransferase [Bifidobacteriaceae bacterium]|nr:NshR/TsnR family 23S rRNA methyltransferase [Bifidobacteriaceae bacterium]